MATGRCTNIMRCSKAKNKEIQEADKANFVCTECGKPLMEVCGTPPGNNDDKKKGNTQGRITPPTTPPIGGKGKLYALIAAAVAVIAVIIVLCMNMCSGGKTDAPQRTGVDTDSVAKEPDTTVVVQQPKETDAVGTEANKDKVEPQKPAKTGDGKVKNFAESGTVNLGYGKYTGKLKNGKPEGEGRIVYTKSHRIAKYDAKERVAQPGESVSGLFHNGEITIGKHFDADGNLIETLNIGSAD